MKSKINRILLPFAALCCLLPWVPSFAALLSGIVLAVLFGNPYLEHTQRLTHKLLTWSVMGLGAGMNLALVFKVGLQGFSYTIVGITVTLLLGMVFCKFLRLEREIGILISVGTAICGGSAIAAIAPTIGAKPHAISVALGTVFFLNAIALLAFPVIGHSLGLQQVQFGLWSALAIHDTSSVVGAGLQYGSEALQIATTVKLARALWIVPLTLAASFLWPSPFASGDTSDLTSDNASSKRKPEYKRKYPWFILGFLVAAGVVTWIPEAQPVGHGIETLAKRTLVLTLFLIGANLNWNTLKSVGVRPFVHGVALWLCAAGGTLGAILVGWIH